MATLETFAGHLSDLQSLSEGNGGASARDAIASMENFIQGCLDDELLGASALQYFTCVLLMAAYAFGLQQAIFLVYASGVDGPCAQKLYDACGLKDWGRRAHQPPPSPSSATDDEQAKLLAEAVPATVLAVGPYL